MSVRFQTAENIFGSRILLHSLLFINSTVKSHNNLLDNFRIVAKELKGKVIAWCVHLSCCVYFNLFVQSHCGSSTCSWRQNWVFILGSDSQKLQKLKSVCVLQMLFVKIDVTSALSHVLKYFGVSDSDAPTVRIIDMETQKKFSIDSGELTVESLRQWCQEVVDGTAKVRHTRPLFIFTCTAALNSMTRSFVCCSHTIGLRRSQRTGTKDQSKSWWARTLNL